MRRAVHYLLMMLAATFLSGTAVDARAAANHDPGRIVSSEKTLDDMSELKLHIDLAGAYLSQFLKTRMAYKGDFIIGLINNNLNFLIST